MALVSFSRQSGNDVDEGAGSLTLHVALSEAVDSPVSVTIVGASYRAADMDVAPRTITIAPGQLGADVSFSVVDDTIVEQNEVFSYTITSATNATIDTSGSIIPKNQALGYILDNDTLGGALVSFSKQSGNDVHEGAGPLTLHVALSETVDAPVSVTIVGASYRAADMDITAHTVTIPAGQLGADVSFDVVDDGIVEQNEVFSYTIMSATNATIDTSGPIIPKSQALGYIIDNDTPTSIVVTPPTFTPTASVNAPAYVQEGVDKTFDVTLTLKNVSSLGGTASLSLDSSSTALQGLDVQAPSALSSFHIVQTPAGDYTLDLGQVTVISDGHREPTETIVLDVTAPMGFLFANGTSSTQVSVSLLDGDDKIAGTAAPDTMSGTAGDDRILAGDGDDAIKAGPGLDIIDGGTGSDTLTFAGFAHDYALALNGGAGTVSGGREGGTDTLTSIEDVQFLDGELTFDTGSTAAQILRLYDSFLGRAPDAAGFQSYLRYVQAGHSFQDMAANAAASPEFANATAGLSDAQYITYVYEHSLHREPDAYGLQQYEQALHDGTLTRTSMIVQAAESPEHVALTAGVVAQGLWVADEKVESLELLYDAAVQRQPDATGIAGYSAEIASGTSYRQIANQMSLSAEFQAAHANQSDAQYIDSLYVAEVGRHADPTGMAAYLDQLAHGYTRGDILWETAFSAEHQSHVLAYADPLLG